MHSQRSFRRLLQFIEYLFGKYLTKKSNIDILKNMEALDKDQKNEILEKLKNVRFKVYTTYDARILGAALFMAFFIFISSLFVINSNQGSIIEYYKLIFSEGGKMLRIYIFIDVLLPMIFIAIAAFQYIRINILNKCSYFECENGRQVLIMKYMFRKIYVICGKQYAVKDGSAVKLTKPRENAFAKLIKNFNKSEILESHKGKKTVYSTKLLDVKSSWLEIDPPSSMPSKYARFVLKDGEIKKGVLSGAQCRCETYFRFAPLNKNICLPDCIKVIAEAGSI